MLGGSYPVPTSEELSSPCAYAGSPATPLIWQKWDYRKEYKENATFQQVN